MDRPRLPRAIAVAVSAAALVAAGLIPGSPAGGAAPDGICGLTTLEASLVVQPDGTLACGPGAPVVVRDDLATPKPARTDTRSGLVSFLTLSDLSIPDEESPLRTEFADACVHWPAQRSFRPQEALIPALVNSHVKAANALAANPAGSPQIHAPYSFAVQLGDGADNQQYNELRTLIDILDGGKVVDPDSGADGYQGVQTQDPTGGSPALTSPVSGASLRDLGNEAFYAPGLRSAGGVPLPWLSVIGQRDVRAGGWAPGDNTAWQTVANAFATGQFKIGALGSQRIRQVCDDPTLLSSPEFWTGVAADPTVIKVVAADIDRRLLSRNEWIAEHSRTTGLPAGHGFKYSRCTDDAGAALPRACYSWNQDPLHFIALDTAPDTGTGAGDIDSAQLAWLERELVANSSKYIGTDGTKATTHNKDRLVVIFTNHASDTLDNPAVPQDSAADGAALEQLLLRFPNVILHVASQSARPSTVAHGDAKSGYWEIQSTSASAWPSRSRSIEIADNHDGTISVFGLLFDGAAPANPRTARWNDDATNEASLGAQRATNEDWLASAAREIALHDPQRPSAPVAASGNVELVLTHPWGTTPAPRTIIDPVPGPGPLPNLPPGFGGFPSGFPTGFPGGLPKDFGKGFGSTPPGVPGFTPPPYDQMNTGTHALAVRPTAGEGAYTTRIILLLLASAAGASWLVQARVRRWMIGI
jgi:metallophosphoesterase (TIGR03767 family)